MKDVMDYQPAILGRVGDSDALLARMARVIAYARRAGLHVGYVRIDTLILAGISTSGVLLSTVRDAADRD
jgi:nicotinamidase-related amidase